VKNPTLPNEAARIALCAACGQRARFVYAVLTYQYVYVVAVNKHRAFLWTSGVYALRSTDCRTNTLAHKHGTPRRSPG
jgi:hypothetical protein